MSRTSEYFRRRFVEIATEQAKRSDNVTKEAQRLNHRARRQIQRQIAEFTKKYANNEVISEETAKKLLNAVERKEWRLTLKEFRQMAKEGGFYKELNAEYFRSRVSRLQRLQTQIDFETARLAKRSEMLLTNHLTESANSTYWQSVETIAEGSNLSVSFAKFNQKMVDELINRPFHGKHFSKRVWRNNRTKLAKELKNILSDSIYRGDSITKMTEKILQRFDVAQNRAATLIRTEAGHVAEQATLKSYKDMSVKQYEWLATLETDRTCNDCWKLHERVFQVKYATIGTTYPLLHPNCRCTTAPIIND